MTEEIILDGVNVAGCEFYDYGNCRECDMRVPFYSDIDCYDKCNKDCCYKQLKRLQKENEELKKKNYTLQGAFDFQVKSNGKINEFRIKYHQALEEIKEMTKSVRYFPQERFELIKDKINEVLESEGE